MKINSLHRDATLFVEQVLAEAQNIKLNLMSNFIDHICYRVETLERYEEAKAFLNLHSQLLIETPINGRLISTFKMNKTFKYKGFEIPLIELPEPKAGSHYKEGFEHIEFVINNNISFEQIVSANPTVSFNLEAISKKRNPDISIQLKSGKIKFHQQSLEDIISDELKEGLNL